MADAKTAGEILESVVESGRKELRRASAGLAFSGYAAGLNISFGTVALAAVGAMTGGIGLAAMAIYPIGFLIVVLGRAQLFTENTVTPVTVALTDPATIPNMLRLWMVVLSFNILGAMTFAAAITYGDVLSPTALELLLERVSHELEYGFWTVVLKGVFGGWLVALIAWLMAASKDTISQAFFIWVLAFLIPVGGLMHSVAGSTEVLISVFSHEASWLEYFGTFLAPTTLGNIIGGVFLVSLLNYGQVVGSRKRTPLAKYLDPAYKKRERS
jgi:formate/nitrite transporter FocA (FNT family)